MKVGNGTNGNHTHHVNKVTAASLLITLGIIYGDIGTSPLYVMKAIVGTREISELLVYGSISCVFWTLFVQTTVKYVIVTLRADNRGEGGIFSLYALVKRRSGWLIGVAIVGGATLLADGIITPPISVCSAVEGLLELNPNIPTVPISLAIIIGLFLFQRSGTSAVGKLFGPIMFIWFSMLGILGVIQLVKYPDVLSALNPLYAFRVLWEYPSGFALLGAVFLCTTGAEALYSDLGHCGRKNIRISWIFVKTCLVLNYFGQGAFLMLSEGQTMATNPFYSIMAEWFLPIGIGIATMAAVIASQALISGSFTLVGEAIRLNLMPKMKVVYPTNAKGQLYIPFINLMLCLGCMGIILYFRESSKMEAAYGLAITITMLSTTILLGSYLKSNRFPIWSIVLFFLVHASVELAFLIANLEKFPHGGYVTVIISGALVFVMWVKLRAFYIKRHHTHYQKIRDFLEQLRALSHDSEVPKFASNLVYLSEAKRYDEVEQKILYSILQKQPKRADIYWFVHIELTDEPYTMEWKSKIIAPDDVVRITFRLGFRVQQRINLFMRLVVEEMIKNKEINPHGKYHSTSEENRAGDFRFVIVDEVLSAENDMPFWERFIMSNYIAIKSLTAAPDRWFGLDTSLVLTEKAPLLIRPVTGINLRRLES